MHLGYTTFAAVSLECWNYVTIAVHLAQFVYRTQERHEKYPRHCIVRPMSSVWLQQLHKSWQYCREKKKQKLLGSCDKIGQYEPPQKFTLDGDLIPPGKVGKQLMLYLNKRPHNSRP